ELLRQARHPLDLGNKARDIAWIAEEPVLAVPDDFTHSSRAASNDDCSGSHRFDTGQAERLPPTGQNNDVAGRIQWAQGLAWELPRERDPRAVRAARQRPDAAPGVSELSGERQPHLAALG